MDGPFEPATAAGLAEVLWLDPTLAAEPERLRRALADVAPFDERGGWLLALGAAAGVPALLERGHVAEAHARLNDLAACGADAAAWMVAAWSRAFDGESPDRDVLPMGGKHVSDESGPAEEPGLPTALRVALGPDGGPVFAAVTTQGVFVVDGVQAYGRWRRVATSAPRSRVTSRWRSRPLLVVHCGPITTACTRARCAATAYG